ncbi:hypothetical protein BFW38_13795 [Terasakiispira papahanaumokuakeensis]|uniref:Fe/B12 periplasmic-binding domain-containing protein n=1 Tax=Terasakiispira papahanaumokuakeensis TaxID=197479 RepID=A0A1E2VCR2_9GAMM|nr:hypothetical protein BFW38_13795 [Terasakiispira papahanaumokuakeensis]
MTYRSYRFITRLLCLLIFSLPINAVAAEAPAPTDTTNTRLKPTRLVALNWTLAETMVGLGYQPLGVGNLRGYQQWVAEPRMPDQVHDLGLRIQPNLELLATLNPDAILMPAFYEPMLDRLRPVAPFKVYKLYSTETDLWHRLQAVTRDVAQRLHDPSAADQLIHQTDATFKYWRQQLAQAASEPPPVLIVQFMDARHMRVFAKHGLYQLVLDQLGLRNVWDIPTNGWGFSMASIDELAQKSLPAETRLIIVDPMPLGVKERLQHSGLWQLLRPVQQQHVLNIPAVWSFGSLPSVQRFTRLLGAALVNDLAATNPPKTAARPQPDNAISP